VNRIGLAGAADRQVKTYSGGMRRRIDVAASLIGRPQVALHRPTLHDVFLALTRHERNPTARPT
jgi:ABC-type Na+ transport system ATPase subunit NatA